MTPRQSCLAFLAFCLLLLTTVAVYWPGLDGPFILDDAPNFARLVDLERGAIDWQTASNNNNSGPLGRPLSMASFAFNTLTSGVVASSFKYNNLMIHLLCGSLILWLSARLFAETRFPNPWLPAIVVAAIWLLAPMLVSTVLYAVQRMAQLSTLFILCGLLSYVIGRQCAPERPRLSVVLVLTTFVVWTPVATLCKENGILLPPLCFLVEYVFFRFRGSSWVRSWLWTLFVVFLALPVLVAVGWLLVNPEYVLNGYKHRDFTFSERFFTEPRILLSYLRGLLIPNGAALGLYHDDYPRSEGLLGPWTTLPAILIWVGLVGWLLVTRQPRVRYLLFGPVFFLVAHSLESGILALELYFEHRNYLPGFGIYFALVLGLQHLATRPKLRRPVIAASLVLPVLFCGAAYQRVLSWQSWPLLVHTNAAVHPNSSRLQVELASLEINNGNLPAALNYLHKAVQLRPHVVSGAQLHLQLGKCINGATQPEIPAGFGTREYAPSVYSLIALDQLTKQITEVGCNSETVIESAELIQQWLQSAPQYLGNSWKVRFNLARLLYHEGRVSEALAELEASARVESSRLEPLLMAVKFQLQSGLIEDARHTVTRLKARNTGSRPDLSKLVGRYDEIVSAYFQQHLTPGY
jgi:tetratricopeptide (TPR) repeat protein